MYRDNCFDSRRDDPCGEPQRHVHEFLGSVRLAELREDPHNHRFAGVSEQAIPVPGGHVHELETRTDFFNEHFHPIRVRTGLPIPVGCGRHVHFACGMTAVEEGHQHAFIGASLIDNPIGG